MIGPRCREIIPRRSIRLALFPATLAALVGLTACGSARTLEKDRLEPVRSVAVIGFGVLRERPNEAMDVVKALMKDEDRNGQPAPVARATPLAARLYEDLLAELGRGTGWKTTAYETLRSSPAYQAFYRERTKQPQLRPLVGRRVEAAIPEGVVEGFLLGNLGETERAKLMRELGVDAVAIATVDVNLVNDANVFQKLSGHGKFKEEVGIRFAVFDRRGGDAIWFDGKAREESADAVEHRVGFASAPELDRIATTTAKRVFAQVLAAYPSR